MNIDSIITQISSGEKHVDVLAQDETEALAIADALCTYWRAARPSGRFNVSSGVGFVTAMAYSPAEAVLMWTVLTLWKPSNQNT